MLKHVVSAADEFRYDYSVVYPSDKKKKKRWGRLPKKVFFLNYFKQIFNYAAPQQRLDRFPTLKWTSTMTLFGKLRGWGLKAVVNLR